MALKKQSSTNQTSQTGLKRSKSICGSLKFPDVPEISLHEISALRMISVSLSLLSFVRSAGGGHSDSNRASENADQVGSHQIHQIREQELRLQALQNT